MSGIRRNDIFINDGSTRLGGRNVGSYPLHHFIHHKSSAGEPGWPIKLLATGKDEWVAGCYRFRENSSILALELVTDGGFHFAQDGRAYDVGPGELFIVHLGKDSEMSTGDIPYSKKRTMIIGGAALRGIVAALGLDKCDVVKTKDVKRLENLFVKAEEVFRAARPGFMQEASSIVYDTLLLLGEGLNNQGLPETLQTALEFLESNIDRRISVKELCARCACSPMTLLRLFRKHLGASPTEHFIGMKMELAKEMLSLDNHPVKEISRQLGYSSQLHFSSEFRKRVGMPPTQYRLRPNTEI